jgi:hypothetical protein
MHKLCQVNDRLQTEAKVAWGARNLGMPRDQHLEPI